MNFRMHRKGNGEDGVQKPDKHQKSGSRWGK